jgi:hypothetical protein
MIPASIAALHESRYVFRRQRHVSLPQTISAWGWAIALAVGLLVIDGLFRP